MNFKKIEIKKETSMIIYKLLYDALFLTIVSFTGMLLIDGLLPGFISSHISFAKITILIIFLLGTIAWIGNKFQVVYDLPKVKKNKLLPFLVLVSFLMIGNSMLKFALWANIVITLIVIVVFFLIYELIFLEKE